MLYNSYYAQKLVTFIAYKDLLIILFAKQASRKQNITTYKICNFCVSNFAVSSPSKCTPIRPLNTPKPLPSLSYNVMAQRIELSSKTPPTKTAPSHKTSAIKESTTSQLNDFPASTAQEAGNDIPQVLPFSPPGSLIRVPHSRISCTRITPTVVTVSTKEQPTKVIPAKDPTEPTEDERNAGQRNLPWKFYAMIFSSLMIFNRLFIM